MPGWPAVGYDLKTCNWRLRRVEQRDDFCFGIKGVEVMRLPGMPGAALTFTCEDQSKSWMFAIAEISPTNLEQPHRRDAPIDVPPSSGDQAR